MGTAPPNVFGPFHVLHQIGAGALGPVFRAQDPNTDRLVAIKVFRLDLAPDRVHRLVAELETIVAADVMHPAIVAPIAVGIEGVEAYLAQEYVEAESLDTAVREHGPVPAERALRICSQLAEALDVAAAANVVHGALHPRDVLLSTDLARLTGLGVARALEAVGVAAPIRRPYTAPERVAGAAWHRAADIFSLGALAHELLWGRRIAATGREVAEALTEIAGGDLLELQEVFASALAEDPDERFATAGQFADALKKCFSHQAPVASPKSPAPSPRLSELRLPLEDDVVVAAAFSDPTPSLEAMAERFIDIDETSEPVGGQQSAGDSLDFSGAGAEPPAPSLQPPVPIPQSKSSLWPIALALVAGSVIGSGVGYNVGTRTLLSDRPSSVRLRPDAPATPPTVRLKPDTTKATAPATVTTAPTAATNDPTTAGAATPATTASRPPTANAAVAPTPAIAADVSLPEVAPTPFVASTGRLIVRSTPVGARVFVDGKDVGRTPVTVKDLARGSHRVRLTHEGYTTTERRVSIASEQLSRSMTVRLERPSARSAAPRTSNPAPGTQR